MFSDYDRLAMQRALSLAARGLASTDPNPRVGCVIAQGTQTVAEGWHARAGEAHAEVVALQAAGQQAAGATVYVTFEPCCHHGRTPPCVEALTQAGVARVVYAATDPNPQVNGRGAEALRAAGITVEAGLLEREALELNCGFVKRMQQGRPWVRLKLAMSLDGRSALAGGASRWISGEAARADVQRWRARSSAILTGIGTVLADDPQLDLRLPAAASGHGPRQPLRVVLDRHLRTPPGARLFTSGWRSARCSTDSVSWNATRCRSKREPRWRASWCDSRWWTSCCCTWPRSCSATRHDRSSSCRSCVPSTKRTPLRSPAPGSWVMTCGCGCGPASSPRPR